MNNQDYEHGDDNNALQLLGYLNGLYESRNKPVTDVTNYSSHILWLDKIPKDRTHCETIAWTETEADSEVWIRVRKYPHPKIPDIPEICRNWVEADLDRDNDIPALLLQSISRTITESTDATAVDRKALLTPNDSSTHHETDEPDSPPVETLLLEDFPEVTTAWLEFIDSTWRSWRCEYEKWKKVQDVHNALFKIEQELHRSPDYELVIGIGLLRWEPTENLSLSRHVLTHAVELQSDLEMGEFTVTPSSEKMGLLLELEMVPAEYRNSGQVKNLRELLSNYDESPWDSSFLDSILPSIGNTLDSESQYESVIRPPTGKPEKRPIIAFAPALFLRKKTTRGFYDALNTVKAQIELNETTPPAFARICEINENKNTDNGVPIPSTDTKTEEVVSPSSSDFYFPRPANEAQHEIATKIDRGNSVLVQGPPGTGKSHSIANMICHLLATGRRILITAQSPRALDVLHKYLPDDVQALCIHLLGDGHKERMELETSVNGILSRRQTDNTKETQQKIARVKASRQKCEFRIAEIDKLLLDAREAETRKFSFTAEYSGNLAQIATRINQKYDNYSWFEDLKTEVVTDNDISDFSEILQQKKTQPAQRPDDRGDWSRQLPKHDDLINIISRLLNLEAGHDLATQSENGAPRSPGEEILFELRKLQKSKEQLITSGPDWIDAALVQFSDMTDPVWKMRFSTAKTAFQALKNQISTLDGNEVFVEDAPLKPLQQAVVELLTQMEQGKKTSGILLSRTTRQQRKLLDRFVRVNDQPALTQSSLSVAKSAIESRMAIKTLVEYWGSTFPALTGSPQLQFTVLDQQMSYMNEVAGLLRSWQTLLPQVSRYSSLSDGTSTSVHTVDDLIERFESGKRKAEIKRCTSIVNEFRNILIEMFRLHPDVRVLKDLIDALDSKNTAAITAAYKQAREKLDRLTATHRYFDLAERLANNYPSALKKVLSSSESDEIWIERLTDLKAASDWRYAKFKLDQILDVDEASLERELQELKIQTEKLTGDLVELLSWSHCLDHLTDDQEQNLIAWQQSVARLGKGTSKYAQKYRKDAQRYLGKCRGAIPAWVMPISRVFDTIEMKANSFDVVVIDEASQCGPDALLLFYLAKQIVIVGDDKQISPSAPGQDLGNIHELQKEWMPNFEYRDKFDFQTSVFAHANRTFTGKKVFLKEHFRCVAEIIEYSNRLSYVGTPLLPLREPEMPRLQPLLARYVPQGTRKGKNARVVNEAEAMAIVETIIMLDADSAYDGKSFGVICLEGQAQAEMIESMLIERNKDDLFLRDGRNLICGNPSNFQGDERDVMFLSMVADSKNARAVTTDESKKKYNVAMSRARDQVWLFHSVQLSDLKSQCLRKGLLEHFLDPTVATAEIDSIDTEALERQASIVGRGESSPPHPFDSWFEVDVALDIAHMGYKVIPQVKAAGYSIDLVVTGSVSKLAVECDGDYWHGPKQAHNDNLRQRQLERVGWVFFRVRQSKYRADREAIVKQLVAAIEKQGIEKTGSRPTERWSKEWLTISEHRVNGDKIQSEGNATEKTYGNTPVHDSTNKVMAKTETPAIRLNMSQDDDRAQTRPSMRDNVVSINSEQIILNEQ